MNGRRWPISPARLQEQYDGLWYPTTHESITPTDPTKAPYADLPAQVREKCVILFSIFSFICINSPRTYKCVQAPDYFMGKPLKLRMLLKNMKNVEDFHRPKDTKMSTGAEQIVGCCSNCNGHKKMTNPQPSEKGKMNSEIGLVRNGYAMEIEDLETGNVKGCCHCSYAMPNVESFKRFTELFVTPTFLQKIVAEIISTFILVFVTCGSSITVHDSRPLVSQLGGSIASGLVVTVMIYSVGHISGAHMNPAVTIAFATVRHFPWTQVPAYIGAQLVGALSASFTLRLMFESVSNTGISAPSGTVLQALVMEIIVSFVLMFVTSAVATDTRAIGELAGIAVGSTVMISSIFAGPISGGSMNPARSLGPAVASNKYRAIWVYIVGPMVGTVMGAWSYSLIRLTDKPLYAISFRSSSSFPSSRRARQIDQATNPSLPNDP
eukprot:Gb_09260 [translate_table: standard]